MVDPVFKEEETRNKLARFNEMKIERVPVDLKNITPVVAETKSQQAKLAENTQRTFAGALGYFEKLAMG